MATTVLDTAALLQAVAGDDEIDDRSAGAPAVKDIPDYVVTLLDARKQGVKGMKIGLLKEMMESPSAAPGVLKAVNTTVEKLRELGADMVEVSVPM